MFLNPDHLNQDLGFPVAGFPSQQRRVAVPPQREEARRSPLAPGPAPLVRLTSLHTQQGNTRNTSGR